MFRKIWQASMISLARSATITRFMQTSRATSFLSDKYVGGVSAAQGVQAAQQLYTQYGIRSSLFYLGEYVDSPELMRENVTEKLNVARALQSSGLDIHISIDPTQIGHSIAPEQARENAVQIADALQLALKQRAEQIDHKSEDAKSGLHGVMFDMEDASVNDATIGLHNQLQDDGYPVALTLQAYLKRTMADMKNQIERGSKVRLVKGAFAAGSDIAYTRRKDIKQNSRSLISLMLSRQAKAAGFYPIIATHDTALHQYTIDEAQKNGWAPGEYEFEMLLGVRTDVARALAKSGERVRLYVPFGRDWWPYAVRRIGENPGNAALLARSLFA